MDTIALRLYGKNDLRLERFDLPSISENEILADIVTNSICMSSHKAAIQGKAHKRVPNDVDQNPVILGHEFCGTILKTGKNVPKRFKEGDKYSIQPALSIPGREMDAPGYSFQHIGGHATRVIIPKDVLDQGCLLPYSGEGYFKASLSEPVSCIVGAFKTSYHNRAGDYVHQNGIVEGGSMAILAGAGPMGLGAIDYAIHGPRKPALLVITDVDQARLDRARAIFPPAEAFSDSVELRYVNTAQGDPVTDLKALTGGRGFDDVFVFAPVGVLIEQASKILGFNGCLNFFAGPADSTFSANINFYDVHYSGHHVVGSSGGNTDDMREALEYMGKDLINPAVMITHVGGINAAAETILSLPEIPGGKKLIYTQKALPLTAIDDFDDLGKEDPFFLELAHITQKYQGLWSLEAEQYFLGHAPDIDDSVDISS